MKPSPRGLLLAFLGTAALSFAAEIPDLIKLWPNAAPGSEKLTITEKITERSTDPQKPDRIYTQIVTPSLLVHRPEKSNGIAVIVAPGGGYQRIVIDKEGPDTSAWLNRLGVTAFILKYRLPGEGHVNAKDVALQDAQRAVRVIRAHAAEWGLDPARVGFLGYSAGGHLAASLEFFFDRKIYAPVDLADQLSARPDFSVLGYASAGATGTRPASVEGLSPRQQLDWDYKIEAAPGVKYPPAFILQADDDATVNPKNAAIIYLALKQNGTPAEMHVFRSGGHGFGIRDAKGPVAHWPDLCAEWMKEIGVLLPPPPREAYNPPPFDARGQPNRQRPGPWDNDALVYRAAADGTSERLTVFSRAGVPTAARLADGRLCIAHQHFPEDSSADFDKVAVNFSSDEGRTWTAPTVIRVRGLPEGMRFPFDPTLVPLPDGSVRLYFTSHEGRRIQDDRPAIYSAISRDAVDFIFEPGVRFGIAGRFVIDCAVVLHRGVFHLFAPDNGAGPPPGGPNPEMPPAAEQPQPGTGYHATSTDGLNFTREPDVHIAGRRNWLGNVQSDGAVMRFFGTGEPGGRGPGNPGGPGRPPVEPGSPPRPGGPGGVWIATSADGEAWTLQEKFASVPGADPGAVALKDGSWLVVVTGPPRPGTPSAQRRNGPDDRRP